MTGTACAHMFHYECCMQWIDKGNDHCPYCRKDMMTKDELFEAAKEELGKARVDKLKQVNVEATQKYAAFHMHIAHHRALREGERPFIVHPPATRQPSAPTTTSQQAPQENNDTTNEFAGPDAEGTSADSTTLERIETSRDPTASTDDIESEGAPGEETEDGMGNVGDEETESSLPESDVSDGIEATQGDGSDAARAAEKATTADISAGESTTEGKG
jgi:hypothetical protein